VLLENDASARYIAVSTCVPAVSTDVVNVAVVLSLMRTTGDVPTATPSSKKFHLSRVVTAAGGRRHGSRQRQRLARGNRIHRLATPPRTCSNRSWRGGEITRRPGVFLAIGSLEGSMASAIFGGLRFEIIV
jgi:hypothetical protein